MSASLTPQCRETLGWLRAHPGWHPVNDVAVGVGTVSQGVSRTVGVLIRRGLAESRKVAGRVQYRATR